MLVKEAHTATGLDVPTLSIEMADFRAVNLAPSPGCNSQYKNVRRQHVLLLLFLLQTAILSLILGKLKYLPFSLPEPNLTPCKWALSKNKTRIEIHFIAKKVSLFLIGIID